MDQALGTISEDARVAHFDQILQGWNQLGWVRWWAYLTTAALLVIATVTLVAYRHVPLTRRQKIAVACFAILIVDEIVLLCLGSDYVFISWISVFTTLPLYNLIRQLRRQAAAG